MTCRILVADDSTPIQKVIKIAFSKYAVEILTAGSLIEAIRECEKSRPDLIIADASLPGVSAASDFTKVLGKSQGAAMIMLMGTYDSVREADLRDSGLESILKKPFDAIELLEACERMLPGRFVMASSAVHRENPPPPPSLNVNLPPPPVSIPPFPTPVAGQAFVMPPDNAPGVPSFLLEDNAPVGIPAIPKIDAARKGQPAFDPGRGNPNEFSRSDMTSMGSLSNPSGHNASSVAAAQEAAEELIRRELPGLVERAVQRYCSENFKAIAKEIITAELRRLTDEKARYLVDQ